MSKYLVKLLKRGGMMINQLFIIGSIKKMPRCDNELVLEVRRNYKNSEGVFLKDNFKCNLWDALSKRIEFTCKEGDLIAIKGRLVDDNDVCKILVEQAILLNKTVNSFN